MVEKKKLDENVASLTQKLSKEESKSKSQESMTTAEKVKNAELEKRLTDAAEKAAKAAKDERELVEKCQKLELFIAKDKLEDAAARAVLQDTQVSFKNEQAAKQTAQAELKLALEQLTNLRGKVARLDSDLTNASANSLKLSADVDNLRSGLKAANTKNAELQREIEKVIDEKRSEHLDLETAQATVAEGTRDLEREREVVKKLRRDLDEQRRTANEDVEKAEERHRSELAQVRHEKADAIAKKDKEIRDAWASKTASKCGPSVLSDPLMKSPAVVAA